LQLVSIHFASFVLNMSRQVRRFGSEENFAPAAGNSALLNGGGDVQYTRDQMIVPNRIIVAGGNQVIGDKPPPHEMALDMHAFASNRYVQNSVLEPPPEKLTLQNRPFPIFDEADYFRQQQQRNATQNGPSSLDEQNSGQIYASDQRPSKTENDSCESLPSTAMMSVLSPGEELALLRNQVRKLTTRLQKLEEEVQDSARHISCVEYVLCGVVLLSVVKFMKSLLFPSRF